MGTPEYGWSSEAGGVGSSFEQSSARADNVQIQVGEAGIVRIFYDLVADDAQEVFSVRLVVSQDGGQTFDVTPRSISGDAGVSVLPGRGKQVVWEAARDVERLDAARLRVRIIIAPTSPRREPTSYWGFGGSVVPWWTISSAWGKAFFNARVADFGGSDLRIGIVRGRSSSGDWGVSLVRKRLRAGSTVVRESIGGLASSTTTYLVTEGVWSTGVETYAFLPFLRLGRRAQLGVTLAGGVAKNFSGTVRRRVEGPIYLRDPRSGGMQMLVAQGPGFVVDDRGNVLEVAPGATAASSDIAASNLYRISGWDITVQAIGRAELAVAFDVRPDLRIRTGGGFNFPGSAFGIELVYLLGVPRRE